MIVALVMVIGLIAPAPTPATTQPTHPTFVILQRDGSLKRSDGGAIANVRGIETMSSTSACDGIVATRGNEVLLIPVDGGEPTLLFKHVSPVRFATIAPNELYLAISASSPRAKDRWNVCLVQRDALDRFTDAKSIYPGFGYDPSFSSDSRLIYFECTGQRGPRIACFNRPAGLFAPDAFADAYTVRCSPDGKWIAFSKDRALNLYRTSTRSVIRLTDGKSYDRFPSFSGEDILFVRETRERKQQVVAIHTDGTNERVLYEGDVMLVCALPAKH
jgi:hypothetical protein